MVKHCRWDLNKYWSAQEIQSQSDSPQRQQVLRESTVVSSVDYGLDHILAGSRCRKFQCFFFIWSWLYWIHLLSLYVLPFNLSVRSMFFYFTKARCVNAVKPQSNQPVLSPWSNSENGMPVDVCLWLLVAAIHTSISPKRQVYRPAWETVPSIAHVVSQQMRSTMNKIVNTWYTRWDRDILCHSHWV